MTSGQLAFAGLVWSSITSVLLVFAYLLVITSRELGGDEDSSAAGSEVEP